MYKTVLMLTYWIFKIINFGKYPKFCFAELKSYLIDSIKIFSYSTSSFDFDIVIGELSKKCLYSDDKTFKCCRAYVKFVSDNFI